MSKRGLACVGLLGTPATIRTGLYKKPCTELGIDVVVPTEAQMQKVELAIRAAIAGESLQSGTIAQVADTLLKRGAEVVILGCTELSLIMSATNTRLIIDPMDCLVETIFDQAGIRDHDNDDVTMPHVAVPAVDPIGHAARVVL